MKIGYLYTFKAYPPKGGNHVHAYQLVRRFLAEGHEVLTWGDDTIAGAKAFPRTPDGARALERAADVLYVRVDANPLATTPGLVEVLESTTKPVVWEINSPANENLAFSWLGGDRRARSGLDALVDGLKRRLHAWRQLPRITREERLRRRIARHASAICVSAAVGEYARRGLGMTAVHVIPNGADHETHRADGPVAELPAEFEGKLTVLYAGSPIYPWQGLDVLEETIRLCEAARDPIRFVLLLNQEGPRPITASNTLSVLRVPHEHVGDYLRAVDVSVVIHPAFFWSEWGSHGSPMKLFDYMACGRPVAASNVGQLAEVVRPGENGILFDNTAPDLRRKLLELAARRDRLPLMGAQARRDVETHYNWHVIGRRTLEILAAAKPASAT
jgi:glycosyltransferase involved in cell wall biosynthesis